MTGTDFNHFIEDFAGELAEQYKARRPSYPAELFDWLASLGPGTGHVWDAGTGTGELAAPLADRFTVVTASDASVEMLDQARPRPNISYRHWPSEEPQLDDGTLDLITAGMAIHWFDQSTFYELSRRLLRPDGALAAVAFYFFDVDDGIGELVRQWYHDAMTGYEFAQLTVLRSHYDGFTLPAGGPFEPLPWPDLVMTERWTFPQLANFLRQWIVVKRARESGFDSLAGLLPAIAERWPGGPETEVEIRWPLFGFAGRAMP